MRRDRIEGIAEAGDHAAISFVYHRHEHQCHRCDGQFTTTSLHHCETVHSWRAMRSIHLAATSVPAEAASATDSLEAAAG